MVIPEYIVNPIGIDKEIQFVQQYLQSLNLIEICFGKTEKINDKPFVFSSGVDYLEVLQNDTIKSHLFFYLHEESANVNDYNQTDLISLICFADLQKVYNDSFAHRPTEEIISTIKNAVLSYPSWNLKKVSRGFQKSLADFKFNIENSLQLQPYFVFKLDFEVSYQNQNKCISN